MSLASRQIDGALENPVSGSVSRQRVRSRVGTSFASLRRCVRRQRV